MKRFLTGLLLTLSISACGPGQEEGAPKSSLAVHISEKQEMSVEPWSTEKSEQMPALASTAGDESLACWVVLNWCTPPAGQPHCTATGCTVEEAVRHCRALYDKTC
ncbi:hypothetical protein [Myxococcus landrumensis]|uniref:Lipoprotein n=1 Tax=Myxococcus landrumensis TaxID=2813577 RepID=A0ABX7NEU4_9BACT|nr:hypothetical protein [Myxococcus landrumus]QSQ17322.1 hypothetical protein JY572_15220 [Myxococcus landrumus]